MMRMPVSGTPFVRALIAALGALGAVAVLPAIVHAEAPPKGYYNMREMPSTPVPVIADGPIRVNGSVLGEINCVATYYGYAWNEHERGNPSAPVRGYGEVVGLGAGPCVAPQLEHPLEIEYARKITTAVSAEMPLELERGEAIFCSGELKTKLSECPSSTERTAKSYIRSVRRRVASLPWKLELIRGEREEEAAILDKVGLHEFGEGGTAQGQSTKCYPKEKAVVEGKEVERPANFAQLPSGCVALDVIFPQIPLEFVYYGTQEVWAVNGFSNGLNASRLRFLQAGKLLSSEGLDGEDEITGELRFLGANGVELLTAR